MRGLTLSRLKVLVMVLALTAVLPGHAFGPALMQAGQAPAQPAVQPQAPVQAPAPPAPAWIPLDLFQVPDGLEITVWAASPQLHNPTNIDIEIDRDLLSCR